jgi:hypothetical protein
LSFAFPLAKDC